MGGITVFYFTKKRSVDFKTKEKCNSWGAQKIYVHRIADENAADKGALIAFVHEEYIKSIAEHNKTDMCTIERKLEKQELVDFANDKTVHRMLESVEFYKNKMKTPEKK